MHARQVIFPAPGEARVETAEIATVPTGHVLLETEATVISPGTEGAIFGGRQSLVPVTYPQKPGYAWVGYVVQNAVAKGNLQVGDRILAMKPHASHATLDPEAEVWVRVPEGLPAEEAALARLIGVSGTTLRTTTARPGDWVAVVGLGIVGLCSALQFQATGYQVIGFDVLPARTQQAQRLGLRHTINASADDAIQRLRDLTDGGCHLVIDASGNVRGEVLAIRVARNHGEVVLLGSPWAGGGTEPIGDLFQQIHTRYIHVRSGWEWSLPWLPQPFLHGSIRENLALAIQLIANRQIPARQLLTEIVSPDDAQRVYTEITEHRDRCLTFAFRWG